MDEIESDHLLVVPDTPEKLSATHKSIFNDHTNTNCGTCLSTRLGNDRSILKGTGDFKRVIHVKKNCSTGDKHDDSCNHMVSRFIGSRPPPPNGGCHFQSGDNLGLHREKVNEFTRINTQLGEMRDKYKPDNGEPSHKSPSKAFRNRRLVRNGCISPSNISMTKQTPECPRKAGVDVSVIDKDRMHHSGSHCVDGPCRDSSKAKGKSIITCSVPSTENDLRSRHPTSRNLCDGCESFNGWRSIRPKRGNSNEFVFDGCGGNPIRESLVGPCEVEGGRECDRVDLKEPVGCLNSHTSSNGRTDIRNGDGPLGDNKIVKRLRMKGPRSVSGGSEVIVIGSPVDISVTDVARSRYCPHASGHNSSVIEIDESPGSAPTKVSDDRDHAHSDYSYAMERQLEEDEIFALKIQEQLYNECSPVNEVDLQVARSLQQTAAPPCRRRMVSVHRSPSSRVAAPRPARVRLNENLNRRGIQAHASTTTTTARNRVSILRRCIRNQPNSGGHGNRALSNTAEADMELQNVDASFDNMLNMCLELRMDILEAMEETFGDQSDSREGRALGVGRDLDLNDYEMLLALDEDNHEHRGATAHLISTLPESVLQGDTFVEHCVICLEIPKSGDCIRHLPCLHKFHKHCIDAWLGRKTSCPVCNSSVF